MSVPVGSRLGRMRTTLAVILALALLAPVGLLDLQLRRATTDDIDHARTERRAVEYLGRLTPLLSAVTEAQSTALRGRTGDVPALKTAIDGVNEVDQRTGLALGAHDRWSALRAKLGTLGSQTGPGAILQAHVEAIDLLLALYEVVRDTSGLQRDPDSDVSHMQQVAAADLPRTVAFATRSADLALLASGAEGPALTQLNAGLAAAAAGTAASVDNLTDNLQRSSDDTASGSLSSSVMGTLDAFRKAIEAITLGTIGGGTGPNESQLANAYAELQQGLTALASTVLAETDDLLTTRIDARVADQRRQLAVVGSAVLGTLLLLLLLLVPRRQSVVAPTPPLHAAPGPPGSADPVPRVRERSGALR